MTAMFYDILWPLSYVAESLRRRSGPQGDSDCAAQLWQCRETRGVGHGGLIRFPIELWLVALLLNQKCPF